MPLSPVESNAIDLSNYAYVASLGILYYDYLLTLPAELAHVWPRARAGAPGAIWFLANRYLSVLGSGAVYAAGSYMHTVQACKWHALAHQLQITAAQLLVVALLFIRTYALYERSRQILFILVGTIVVLAGASLWTLGGQKTVPFVVPRRGCHLDMSYATAVRISLIWWSQFAFDSLVFGLTLARTWRAGLPRGGESKRRDLLYVLRRDGAMYFGCMAVMNLCAITTFYAAHNYARGALTSIASSTSVTLMSRLLLNMHRAASPNSTSASWRTRAQSEMAFSAAPRSDSTGVLTTQLGSMDDAEPKDWWAADVDERRSEDDQRGVPPLSAVKEEVEMDGMERGHRRSVGFVSVK